MLLHKKKNQILSRQIEKKNKHNKKLFIKDLKLYKNKKNDLKYKFETLNYKIKVMLSLNQLALFF